MKGKRIINIEYQQTCKDMKYGKCLSYPLPFNATQIINPFLDSMISANHEKGEEFQLMKCVNPNIVYLLFLSYRILGKR